MEKSDPRPEDGCIVINSLTCNTKKDLLELDSAAPRLFHYVCILYGIFFLGPTASRTVGEQYEWKAEAKWGILHLTGYGTKSWILAMEMMCTDLGQYVLKVVYTPNRLEAVIT